MSMWCQSNNWYPGSISSSPERDAINGSEDMLVLYTKTDWKLNRKLKQRQREQWKSNIGLDEQNNSFARDSHILFLLSFFIFFSFF